MNICTTYLMSNAFPDTWRGSKRNKQIPRSLNKVPRALISPMIPRWANNPDVVRLRAKPVPKNLIWIESVQWLRSSSVRNISGALITPIGTPIMPPRANNHGVAYLQTKTVKKWFGVNQPSGCWVPASARFQRPLFMFRGAFITPKGMPMWPQWANDHDVTHLEPETGPMKLIWSDSA